MAPSCPEIPAACLRRQLLAFARVFVPGSGSATAVLSVPPAAHAVLREPDLLLVVEPGALALHVGGSSSSEDFPGTSGAGVQGSVLVVGPAVDVEKCARAQERPVPVARPHPVY